MKLVNVQRRQKILEDLYSFLLQKKLETSIASRFYYFQFESDRACISVI